MDKYIFINHNSLKLNTFLQPESLSLTFQELKSFPKSAIREIILEKGKIISEIKRSNTTLRLFKIFDSYAVLTEKSSIGMDSYSIELLPSSQVSFILNTVFLNNN